MATSGVWQASNLGGMPYYVLLPDNYSPDQSYPVLLYLHGGGQEPQVPGMLNPWFNTPDFRAAYPAIVVAPIIKGSSLYNNWGGYPVGNYDNQNQALAILQSVMTQFSGDSSRVYVTGLSLGGYGSWDLMIKDNIYDGTQGRIFAAGMPLAGAWSPESYSQVPDQAIIDELRSIPIWAVVGFYNDPLWASSLATDLGTNSAYHFTEPYLGHDVWDTTYPLQYGKPYYDWMFSQAAPSELSLPGNAAMIITGTASGQTVTDVTPLSPFAGVTVIDRDTAQTETVTVTLSAAANGVLSNLGGGSYNSTTGVYTDGGSAAAVTTALDGLVFTPTGNAAPGQTVTTNFTLVDTDTAGASATDSATSVTARGTLIGGLGANQQLELIYVAYFGRAADGGGFNFWAGQDFLANAAGKTAMTTLTDIANAFAPQPETIGLYPFLGTSGAASGVTSFVDGVFSNLFGRAPDAAGETYWVGQLTSGSVALGTAALAIANGATGVDAIKVQNKITVALDFTTRTAAAGLGESVPLSGSLVTAARSVLNGVDGSSLNDASVTAAMNATTTFLSGSATGHSMGLATDPAASTVITITDSDQLIDPGAGNHTIQFLDGASADTLVLHHGGVDLVSGFDATTDVLDLRTLFREANVSPGAATLTSDLTITDIGSDAVLSFDPAGLGHGSPVAILDGLAGTVTGVAALLTNGAIRVA